MYSMDVYFEGKKKVVANLFGTIIKTDQPVRAGGEGTAPAPFDLFLASLGTCAGIYVKGFCDSRGISTDGIRLVQHMDFDPESGLLSYVKIEIMVPKDFPEQYYSALIRVADKCKVKMTLHHPPQFEVVTTVYE